MSVSERFKDWSPVLAAVITVAGGLALVQYQASEAGREFTTAVRDSDQLRDAVLMPLEGQWSYDLEFDEYYRVPRHATDTKRQFNSEGRAMITWDGRVYRILLGYHNFNRDGRDFSVSVNIGQLSADPADGLPTDGSAMRMDYVYRMGADNITIDGRTIDYSNTLEAEYEYTIEGIEHRRDGKVGRMTARYDGDQSGGAVVFTRID